MNCTNSFFKKFRKPCLQMDARTDVQTSGWIQYTPIPPLVEWGYKNIATAFRKYIVANHFFHKHINVPVLVVGVIIIYNGLIYLNFKCFSKMTSTGWLCMSQIHTCRQVPLQCGPIYHDIVYSTAITEAEYEWDSELTKDTPHLTLMGELWGVSCEYFDKNWLHYNSTVLYICFLKASFETCLVH